MEMRWTTLVICLFIISIVTIEWLAVVKLYNNWVNKRNVKVLDVAELKFHSYLGDFNKTYNNEEYKRRFENFKASLKDIARLNRLENNTVFGLTKFSDMSKTEFAARMLQQPVTTPPCTHTELDCTVSQENYKPFINEDYRKNIPPSFDWRTKGVVKSVLNQKMCSGCWAFSIVGVLESMAAIQLKDYQSRSIQELLDCSTETRGCYSGNVVIAMKFICKRKLEFVTEKEYPMTLSIDQECKLPKTGYSGRRVKSFVHNCNMNEDNMVEKIATHGPLIVAVDAKNWMNYIGGVITRACTPVNTRLVNLNRVSCGEPWWYHNCLQRGYHDMATLHFTSQAINRGISNHVVQIVGYEGYGMTDEETPIPYYIVRNSYGEDFGDHGYVKVAMKNGDIADVCGIAEQVTFMDVM